jgi:hypothetical protein
MVYERDVLACWLHLRDSFKHELGFTRRRRWLANGSDAELQTCPAGRFFRVQTYRLQ